MLEWDGEVFLSARAEISTWSCRSGINISQPQDERREGWLPEEKLRY